MSRVVALHMIVVKEKRQEDNLTTKNTCPLCFTTSFKQTNVILYRAQKAALLFSTILRSIVSSRQKRFFSPIVTSLG